MKNYKEKQINFCWTPFGYSYSVPLSLGYLKSSLTENGFKDVVPTSVAVVKLVPPSPAKLLTNLPSAILNI